MTRLLSLLLIALTLQPAFAQKEANIWHFGTKAGINFNSNPPQALYGGKTSSFYGHSSMADSTGNLLFYVDGGYGYPGSKVYDNRHIQMPNNGFGGNSGNFGGWENTLLVPWPIQNGKYFLFSDNPNNEVYSVIDMSLNNGYGSVQLRNVYLQHNVITDVVGLQHKNNRDYWVIFQENQLNSFKSYLVSPTGLNLTPVVSNLNLPAPGSNQVSFTTIKASPEGTTLAYTDYAGLSPVLNKITLLNFDNATGQITLRGAFPNDSTTYALEFSPDGKKLYCLKNVHTVGGTNKLKLVQYDLTSGTLADIFASGVTISQWPGSNGPNQFMQAGPDGRIYITDFNNNKFLHVINRPNLPGLACRFRFLGFDLDPLKTGQIYSWGGLPSFVQSYFYRPAIIIRQTCSRNTATFSLGNNAKVDSVEWNFGDPGSGSLNNSSALNPSHFYGAGSYLVQAIVYYNYASDTVSQTIIIPPALAKPNLGPDQYLCPGDSIVLNAFQTGATYQWQDSLSTNPSFTVTTPGTYWVKMSNGCSVQYDSITITAKPPLTQLQDTTLCTGDILVLRASPGLSYRWNTADTTRQITVSKAGVYKVEIETLPGCFYRDSATVKEKRCFKTALLPNIVTPNNDKLNDKFEPKGLETGSYELSIYNRWGVKIYQKKNYAGQWPEKPVTAGTYYYLLRNKASGKTYKGWVEVAN